MSKLLSNGLLTPSPARPLFLSLCTPRIQILLKDLGWDGPGSAFLFPDGRGRFSKSSSPCNHKKNHDIHLQNYYTLYQFT